jgi:F-type H+-transporting ATPase subunit epsilon
MPLQLEIITPMGVFCNKTVEYVSLQSSQGELGILPDHEPLITTLSPGELHFTEPGGDTDNLVTGMGFLQIVNDRVTVVTDLALKDEQIDETSVEKAIEAAQEALKKRDELTREEQAQFEANLMRQMAVLSFKKKKKTY